MDAWAAAEVLVVVTTPKDVVGDSVGANENVPGGLVVVERNAAEGGCDDAEHPAATDPRATTTATAVDASIRTPVRVIILHTHPDLTILVSASLRLRVPDRSILSTRVPIRRVSKDRS